MLHGPKLTQRRAAKLRREMSLPEVLLWQQLRKRPGGLRFRRQHPAGAYSLDFFCPRYKLAIEVDGEAHERGDQPERDAARDAGCVHKACVYSEYLPPRSSAVLKA
ncbi:endonuclease domain-containing protein [Sphingomonas sp. DT-207]|uniref:endonuclease domain-containing protein n=1 Tax=Sphingomonas sp. DT-207 TaxID=3396167 RepID=UPI003F1C833B